ncbi:MAG: DNA-binding response regulator [candidate division Zixibacteria bacterium RBG_16_50_21]|nr:MAG: DNA-binding response regulator [candidate division Zixibacteria bacterium RBG_16_50_21]
MPKKILVIEDDLDIAHLLKHYLIRENYSVSTAASGNTGLNLVTKEKPDLVILDLMLPEMDGLEVCRQLRRNPATAQIPILILTAKGEETDKVVGLEMGGDDYVTKPFSSKELLARVRALLRRYERKTQGGERFSYGDLILDAEKHEITSHRKGVNLTSKEFGLLQALLENTGRVMTRETLMNRVWGEDYYGGARTVDVHIRKLREKIPSLSKDIVTLKNLGYKLKSK